MWRELWKLRNSFRHASAGKMPGKWRTNQKAKDGFGEEKARNEDIIDF
jgi:hypothetical protein